MSRSATCNPLASPKAVRPGEFVPYKSPGDNSHRGVRKGKVWWPDTRSAPSLFDAPATHVTARKGKYHEKRRASSVRPPDTRSAPSLLDAPATHVTARQGKRDGAL